MSAADLVPGNHSHRERALAAALEPIAAIDPRAIETLWDAWRCPSAFLPFLAYALSVDLWDDAWDENRRRQAIADSPEYHRRKGTRRAVELASATLGRESRIVEWHEVSPPRRRGTFQIQVPSVSGDDQIALLAAIDRMRRLVIAAKPKSRAFSVAITVTVEGAFVPSCGIFSQERAIVAVPPDDLSVSLTPSIGIAMQETIRLGAIQ